MMYLRCPCCDSALSDNERHSYEENEGWCNECISISAQDVREWEEIQREKLKEGLKDETTSK